MSGKRIIHAEVDDRTFVDVDGINRGLGGLVRQAEDSCDFEDILNYAVDSLFRLQPNGKENYGDEKSKIGRIRLCRFNNQMAGKTDIDYIPSSYEKGFKYVAALIGTIDLRERTYKCNNHEIPKVLIRDLNSVMKCLGLKLVKNKRIRQYF